jgi:hypothetical protein
MRTRTSLCGVPKIEGGLEPSFNIFGIFLLKGVSLGGLGEVDFDQRKVLLVAQGPFRGYMVLQEDS